jgi:hypothetical protein
VWVSSVGCRIKLSGKAGVDGCFLCGMSIGGVCAWKRCSEPK